MFLAIDIQQYSTQIHRLTYKSEIKETYYVNNQLCFLYVPYYTVTIYATIAHEFKSRHDFSCQSCDNSKNGAFSSLVRLDYVVCSTMYDVVGIHVHLYIL